MSLTDAGGVLVIGAGGLASPALPVLVKSGVTQLTLVDDDRVEVSNLHRQTLYAERDVGRLKVDAAADALRAMAPHAPLQIARVVERFTPDNALRLLDGHVLALEGSDNYATKFLASDAARIAGVPIVQAGAVRFSGWALGVLACEGPCVRCVFEDIPRGQRETCAIAGVLGPVVGVLGALEAAVALELLHGREHAAGVLWSFDALDGGLRRRRVRRRADCPLCRGEIRDVFPERYLQGARACTN